METRSASFALTEKAELEYWFHLAKNRPKCIRLDKGEPDFPPHPHITETAVRLIQSQRVKYSSGLPELKRAIAARLRTRIDVDYHPETEVCITHGAIGGLFASCAVIGKEGGQIAVSDVAWPTFGLLIKSAGATVTTYPLFKEPGESRGEWPTNMRALVVNSPHNPTGKVMTRAQLQALADKVQANGAWIISDETYEALTFAGHPHVSIASLPGMREHTLVVGSFSKIYCMTGWRIGYVAGPAGMIRQVAQVSHLTTGGGSLIAQYAALAALETPAAYIQEMVDVYQRRAELAARMLLACPALRVQSPEGTFYLFINIEGCTDNSRLFTRRLLETYGVAAVPGAVFGPAGEGHLRLSLTVDEKQLRVALQGLLQCAASFI